LTFVNNQNGQLGIGTNAASSNVPIQALICVDTFIHITINQQWSIFEAKRDCAAADCFIPVHVNEARLQKTLPIMWKGGWNMKRICCVIPFTGTLFPLVREKITLFVFSLGTRKKWQLTFGRSPCGQHGTGKKCSMQK
jgi:hypothetical protein